MIREILTLGNARLYERSAEVAPEDKPQLESWITDLHDTLMEYRSKHNAGRAIAAPQIGIRKRLIYRNTGSPCVFINPKLIFPDGEKHVLLDDCMSFPGLVVRVERYQRVLIQYKDEQFAPCEQYLEGDMAELLQHEYDHLDGILSTMRAVDNQSFFIHPNIP